MTVAIERFKTQPSSEQIAQFHDLASQLYTVAPSFEDVAATTQEIVSSSSRALFVARQEGIILGQLVCTDMLEPGLRFGYIGGVVVDERLRGQRIGTRLTAAAHEYGESRGYRYFDLSTSKPAARLLYESMGYHPRQTTPMRRSEIS